MLNLMCQHISTTMKYYCTSIRKAKILTTPNAGENMEQQKLLFIADGNTKYTTTLEDSLVISYKAKPILAIWTRNHTPRFYPGKLKICPQKKLNTEVHESFIHNCQKLGATKIYFSRWINKLWDIYAMEFYSVIERNKPWSCERHGKTFSSYY